MPCFGFIRLYLFRRQSLTRAVSVQPTFFPNPSSSRIPISRRLGVRLLCSCTSADYQSNFMSPFGVKNLPDSFLLFNGALPVESRGRRRYTLSVVRNSRQSSVVFFIRFLLDHQYVRRQHHCPYIYHANVTTRSLFGIATKSQSRKHPEIKRQSIGNFPLVALKCSI